MKHCFSVITEANSMFTLHNCRWFQFCSSMKAQWRMPDLDKTGSISNHLEFSIEHLLQSKIVSRCYSHPQPDPRQATVARKNSHVTGRNLERDWGSMVLLMNRWGQRSTIQWVTVGTVVPGEEKKEPFISTMKCHNKKILGERTWVRKLTFELWVELCIENRAGVFLPFFEPNLSFVRLLFWISQWVWVPRMLVHLHLRYRKCDWVKPVIVLGFYVHACETVLY